VKRVIDGGRIRTGLDPVWLEEYDVRAGAIGLIVLAANALRRAVCRPHLVTIVWLDLWTHRTHAGSDGGEHGLPDGRTPQGGAGDVEADGRRNDGRRGAVAGRAG